MKTRPKLRTVEKSVPLYPLNQFPKKFPHLLGRELVYILAVKSKPVLEGAEWEEIFARCIGAEWKPSNVGLDDVVFGNTAWGAKTVKARYPKSQSSIRLISGRNSPLYSFDQKLDVGENPNKLGSQVLDIWNERVSAVRERYASLRTIVLIKSNDLTEVVVFEFETIRYDQELFDWHWNKKNNLVGVEKASSQHKFTWQPHGSQFTIIEDVPADSLLINVRKPIPLDRSKILAELGFDDSWINAYRGNG